MVIDTSSLISLARSGLLSLLELLPIKPTIPEVVEREAVRDGLQRGRPDAAAIEAAIASLPREPSPPGATPDAAVLEAARAAGSLIANDLALGRRARNLGLNWLRTADVVLLLVMAGRLETERGRSSIGALTAAGRISEELAAEYLMELP